MSAWNSYPSIYNLGHKAVETLFMGPVLVEEKVDGSQFSFGVFDGELKCRSRGQQLVVDAPETMFARGVETAIALKDALHPEWCYRGEYLNSPKHNTLRYGRHPERHVILFDIGTGDGSWLSYNEKKAEAERIGLEVVPVMHEGMVESANDVRGFLERDSCLGGCKIEGVVIKNYAQFGPDKKTLMGKFVSEAFKEIHGGEWRKNNPVAGDVIQNLILSFKTEARWKKAVQHLREAGQLQNDPRDIGLLLKELGKDLHADVEEDVKQALFKWAWPKIQRGAIAGFPEWYKQQLLDSQFEKPTQETVDENEMAAEFDSEMPEFVG